MTRLFHHSCAFNDLWQEHLPSQKGLQPHSYHPLMDFNNLAPTHIVGVLLQHHQ